MYGQMNPIDVWLDVLLRGEMERLIWKWKTAWGEVGKHSGLDRKILLSPSFSPNLPLSGEITVPMATQLIAWKLLWLWVPWQHITLHYTGVKSLPVSLCCVLFAYTYTSSAPSWWHTPRPPLVTWVAMASGWQQVRPLEPPPTPPWSFWFPIQTQIMFRRLIPCYTRITALWVC